MRLFKQKALEEDFVDMEEWVSWRLNQLEDRVKLIEKVIGKANIKQLIGPPAKTKAKTVKTRK